MRLYRFAVLSALALALFGCGGGGGGGSGTSTKTVSGTVVSSAVKGVYVCSSDFKYCTQTNSGGNFTLTVPLSVQTLVLALKNSAGNYTVLGDFPIPSALQNFYVSPQTVIPTDTQKAAVFRTLIHLLGGDSSLNSTVVDLDSAEIDSIDCGSISCGGKSVEQLLEENVQFNITENLGGGQIKVEVIPSNGTLEFCSNGSCTEVKPKLYDWLVLVYMDADNNLNDYARYDLNEMALVKVPPSVKLVVFEDTYGNNGAYIYETDDESGYLKLSATAPEPDMGDPKTLEDVVNYWSQKYPSSKRVLILWNHGDAWRNLKAWNTEKFFKSAAYDETSDDLLYMYELKKALENITDNGAKPFDVIGFDECLMGNLEVFYDIANYTRYIVASEQLEPAEGWDYQKLLQCFLKYREIENNAFSFAKAAVDAYKVYTPDNENSCCPPTMMAVPSQSVSTLVEGLNKIALQYLSDPDGLQADFANARAQLPTIYDESTGLVDLYNLALLLNSTLNGNGTEEIINAFRGFYGYTTDDNFKGISIYFPSSSYYLDDAYFCNETVPCENGYYNPFTQTYWDDFLKSFLGY